jgi:hypothetical protein
MPDLNGLKQQAAERVKVTRAAALLFISFNKYADA